jgi:osmotically-inducible protein OsmY
MNIRILLLAAGVPALAAAACTPVGMAIGGGAVVARSVSEERTTMDALDDSAIELSISNALLNHSYELFSDVSVTVTEGRVLLTGSVPKPEDKVEATRIAWATEGVTAVEDSLTIGGDRSAGTYLRDVRISNTLRIELLADVEVSSVNYNIETIDGVVHLSGLAKSKEELDRVIRHAQGISGVKRVVSHVLTIDDPRRVTAVANTG